MDGRHGSPASPELAPATARAPSSPFGRLRSWARRRTGHALTRAARLLALLSLASRLHRDHQAFCSVVRHGQAEKESRHTSSKALTRRGLELQALLFSYGA